MVKNIVQKFIVIILLMMLVLTITSCGNQCHALGDVTSDTAWQTWSPTVNGSSKLSEKIGTILGVISVIGVVVSVITLSVIGIKTMLGSVEEKANYKQALLPWTIGAVMVFAITTIPTIIYNFTQGTIMEEVESSILEEKEKKKMNEAIQNMKNYISGLDDAYRFADKEFYTISKEYRDKNKKVGDGVIKYEGIINDKIKSITSNEEYWRGYKDHLTYIQKTIMAGHISAGPEQNDNEKVANNLDDYFRNYTWMLQDIDGCTINNIDAIEETISSAKYDEIKVRLTLEIQLLKMMSSVEN